MHTIGPSISTLWKDNLIDLAGPEFLDNYWLSNIKVLFSDIFIL